MGVIYGLENVTSDVHGCGVSVGVFDGVHWGHHAIFQRLVETCEQLNTGSLALTFRRHPLELLTPGKAPQYITTLEQKIDLIQASGVETVLVADFNQELANLSRIEFLRHVLWETLRAKSIVVGANFRFGRNRAGDVRYLAGAAPALGVHVVVEPSVIIGGAPVSSTRVRAFVSRGEMEQVSRLLGYRFCLRGTVVKGEGLGRKLGFPTANVETARRQLLPSNGVYAVEACVEGNRLRGVCNIGTRPTFGSSDRSVEVHLPGFEGNIYGSAIDVMFAQRLREEIAFESPECLADQIRRDLDKADRVWE